MSSSLFKRRMEACEFAQTAGLLDRMMQVGDSPAGIPYARVEHLKHMMFKYARIDEADAYDPSPSMEIRFSLFVDELHDLDVIVAYARGGGFPWWDWPDCNGAGYWQEVASTQKAYFDARRARETKLRACIREYILQCRVDGVNPVKKRIIEKGFSAESVYAAWREVEKDFAASGGGVL